ncbi:MAG: ABC transporter permease [Anaerolineales bacterium]|nr:ABC transporter permease [Anaerolineales bacterium]
MPIGELLRVAWRGLAANKLRAALTMLGIIIGVGAVITLLSVGKGVERYVTAQFQGIGSNLLFVFPGGPADQEGPPVGANRDQPLTNDDGLALGDPVLVPSAQGVALEYLGFAPVEYSRETMNVQVSGVSPNYQEVRQFYVGEGDFITEADERSVARIAVLGQTVVRTLFPNGEFPMGQTIKISQVPFKVVGVLEAQGGSLFGDQDSIVLVPLTTAQQRLFNARQPDGRYGLSIVYVQARSGEAMESAAREVAAALRERHDIDFRDEDDFTVVTQNDLISAFGEVTGVLTIFLGAIAGISLLVGGIGIMNIMLVSVTERTREIGLRKAVGARRRDILAQFLIEAVTLALLGGMFGIAIGAAGSYLVASFQPDLPVAVTLDSVLLATGFSAAIGLFFGMYPAVRASALNPIDALRYE